MLEPTIIFEDGNILALNKPAGWRVGPDDFHVGEKNILDWARQKYPEAQLAHRLDKETSGVLLLAKTPASYEYLKKQFHDHLIHKTYQLIVVGKMNLPVGGEGEIAWPIGHHPSDARQRLAIDPRRGMKNLRGKFREALTKYKVLEKLGDYTYLEAYPRTGRTHQLRVHFKALGHPIVGDKLYNPKPGLDLISRQALHAAELSLTLPSGQPLTLKAPLPADFQQTLDNLRASC